MADAAYGLARIGPGRLGSEQDWRVVAWIAFGAGLAIAVVGSVAQSVVLIALGGLIVAGLGAILAPQLLLAVFLVAGGLKAAPFLAGLPVDLTVLTAAGVLVAIGLRAFGPEGIPSLPTAAVLGVLIAALVSGSVLWAPDPSLALDKALRFQTFTMIAFFAPLFLLRSRDELKRLMVFVVLASLVVAVTAVPGEHPNQPLTVAGGESEIELALYSSAGMVACVGYLMLVPGSPLRLLWLLPAGYLANTVLAAGSRGVLIGSILALTAIAVMAIARSRLKVVPVVVVAIAAVVSVVTFSQLTGPAAAKYAGLFQDDPAQTFGKRNFVVQDGIRIALDHPMGIGAGGYEAETGLVYPHNAFVEITAEQGIIGLGLLLALMAAAFWSSFRAPDGIRSPETVLAIGLLIVLVADSMVSQSFTQFRLLWFALGLALALPWIGTAGRRAPGG